MSTTPFHVVPGSRKMELYFHFPICLYGVVLKWLIRGTTLVESERSRHRHVLRNLQSVGTSASHEIKPADTAAISCYIIAWYMDWRTGTAGSSGKISVCIHYVVSRNLGQDAKNPDWCSSWFFSVPPGEYHVGTSSYTTTVSFHFLSNSLPASHPTI
jgi:hypothetical protein